MQTQTNPPQPHAIRVVKVAERPWSGARPSQRDLVAASLLARPDRPGRRSR